MKKKWKSFLNLSYRKAPEFPFPIPTEDCYAVVKYLIDNPEEFNADTEKIIFAGDSAGW